MSMNKYHVTIVERVIHDCYVEAEDFHSAGMKAIESRELWTEDLDAYSVETGEMFIVGSKCYECGWEDSNPSFFYGSEGKFYCSLHKPMSWGELADLTHETQVERFGFCSCEEQEQFPYEDCPRLNS